VEDRRQEGEKIKQVLVFGWQALNPPRLRVGFALLAPACVSSLDGIQAPAALQMQDFMKLGLCAAVPESCVF
jgi:hypothetical protein